VSGPNTVKLTFLPSGQSVEFENGKLDYQEHGKPQSILDVAMNFGIHLEHACGGSCACTTCHVVVKKGKEMLNEATEEELDRLDQAADLQLESRLGCQTVIDLAVRHASLVGWAILVGPTVDPRARTLAAQIGRGALDLLREPPDYWPLLTWDYLTAGPLRTLATLRMALDDPVVEKLSRVRAPTLVIRGSRDPIAPSRWVQEMADRLPLGQALEIPGAAHVVNYAAPKTLAQAIRLWVAQQPPVEPVRPALPGAQRPVNIKKPVPTVLGASLFWPLVRAAPTALHGSQCSRRWPASPPSSPK
jgi:ferredoxin